MLNNYMAAVFVAGKTEDMRALTKDRPISAVSTGGRYKVIDFALSNLTNSGVGNIGIFTGNHWVKPLYDHVKNGQSWDLGRKKGGVAYLTHSFNSGKIVDTSNIENNMKYFLESSEENLIIIDPDMIYKVDFRKIVEEHEKNSSEVTVLYKKITEKFQSFKNCDTVNMDAEGNVQGIGTMFFNDRSEENVSLGCFIISKNIFIKMISDSVKEGNFYRMSDILSRNVSKYKVKGIAYEGYLKCINSTKNYFDFNMDILDNQVKQQIFYENGNIYTKIQDTPPSVYGQGATLENSLVANGCVINGKVKNSVIGRRVEIQAGAKVENCIIFQDCVIEAGAELKNVIIAKKNVIGRKEMLMGSADYPLVIEKGDSI